MKRLTALIVAGLLAVSTLAFANGSSEQQGAASSSAKAAPVKLHIFHFKQNLADPWNAMTEEYTRQFPNVKIENEIIGGGAQWQTILTAKFAANEGPDIFIVEGPSQVKLWGDHIADLSGQPWIKRVLPFALKPMEMNGKVLGMPVNMEGYGFIYNKKIFKDVGITTLPGTFSALKADAQKIKQAGYTPFGSGFATWWVIGYHGVNIPFAQQPDPEKFIQGLNDGTATFAANPLFKDWKNMVDLITQYGEPNPLTTDHRKQVQLFANNKVAMIQQGDWKEIDIYSADPKAQIGLLPIPLNDSPKMDRIPVGVPFYFVVDKTSSAEKQAAAKTFLNWMVSSPTGQSYITDKFKMIPVYKDMQPKGLGGVSSDILAFAAKDKVIPWTFGQFPDGWANDVFNDVQSYVARKMSWDQVLQQMQQSWTQHKK